MKTVSWVIRLKSNKKVIMETYSKFNIDHLNTEIYEAIPILDHLVEINRKIKSNDA